MPASPFVRPRAYDSCAAKACASSSASRVFADAEIHELREAGRI
jgi:hypothetical protein